MSTYRRRDYHSVDTAWRNSRDLNGSYVGIELEVEALTTPYGQLLGLLPDLRGRARPITETDGSLSFLRGVEIVFPPFKPSSIKRKSGAVKRVMESIKHIEMSTNNQVGMHMNINVQGWSRPRVLVAALVVHKLGYPWLTYLGGRGSNQYCSTYNYTRYDYAELTLGMSSHASATSVTNSRLELRFPKSTTDSERLDRLLDFIHQLERWSEQKTDDPRLDAWRLGVNRGEWIRNDFLEFMSKNRVGRRVLAYVEEKKNERTRTSQAA